MVAAKTYVIMVAGIPASGKTTYGRHIAEKLSVPLISKDAIKETLYDAIHYDTAKRENSQIYGGASFAITFHMAGCLMRAGTSFVLEGNFTPASADILRPLVTAYEYLPLTVMFDAEMKTLHRRFCERENADERHPGLIMRSGAFEDFDYFCNAVGSARDFSVGEKLLVDTTDFSAVNYDHIDRMVINYIGQEA
ncbi:MAG: ATP-binding protein [Defluviitaleaceae bacterium]|nr:ATP-binding protein [Defluviitaleaceae bacterium]